MTGMRQAVAPGSVWFASCAGTAAAPRPPGAGSRQRSRASRDGDSCQQIQSLTPECARAHSMISAMNELPYHLTAGCQADAAAHISAYTVAHKRWKERG